MCMSTGKMHSDEADINVTLVACLLAAQFPQWADLTITPVASAGTDHALYRLGSHLVVRLPRIASASEQVDKEQNWLPRLASHLPLAIPVPRARGKPGEGYPWSWSVSQWLDGETATSERSVDLAQEARDLAHLLIALQKLDAHGGPPPGPHNAWRGVPLSTHDAETCAALASLVGILDTNAARAAWESALQAPLWSGPPVWIHGDLSPLNLLTKQGRLWAVIDFGCLGVGDPACDLHVAWNWLSAHSRATLREALTVDEATWARGRGWSFSVGLIALPSYQQTNPVLASVAWRTIEEVLAESNG